MRFTKIQITDLEISEIDDKNEKIMHFSKSWTQLSVVFILFFRSCFYLLVVDTVVLQYTLKVVS